MCLRTYSQQQAGFEGHLQDEHTKEPVAFASVFFVKAQNGKYSDSLGNFYFSSLPSGGDTLVVSYVGYETIKIPIAALVNKSSMTFNLRHSATGGEVVVTKKINKGLFLWKKIMSKKDAYNRYNFGNFGYEAYNKLEIDARNFKADKLKNNFLLKPYAFVFDNIDSTSEDRPFLPMYLVESLSDYAFQKSPKKYRENIKAALTKGITNESITNMLGVMNQNVNIYANFIPVMDKNFISPFNDNADDYYKFSVADTQVLGKQRIYHFIFRPKRPGQNTFEGEAWVSGGDFRVRKISMYLGKDANINYIERISIFQEYQPLNDSVYFVTRDKFFADFNLLSKKSLSFIGRKTTSYKNIVVNSDSIKSVFAGQNIQELVTAQHATEEKEANWQLLRHDSLSKNERSIYATIDRLQSMPKFQKLQTNLRFLATGYKNVGNAEIGPWFNWISSNSLEGLRLRWDLGTNYHFDKNVYLHGYIAYGTKDNKFKGKAEGYWVTARRPRWTRIHAAYSNDIDNGISRLGEVSQDNIFTLAIRKPNAYQRFLQVQDTRFEVYTEWGKGFSTEVFLAHRKMQALKNLPDINPTKSGLPLQNFEAAIKLRFAYLEQFVSSDYFRYSMGTNYPVGEFIIARGFKNAFGAEYGYTKLHASIKDNIKISPYGDLSLKLYGGKVIGAVPYPMLEIHPGNNLYYFMPSAFNLMTRFEYISDKYAGLNVEHHFGSGLFRFVPMTRKMKLRQFWNAKILKGSLSAENQALSNANNYFKTLNGTYYAELGTGIDNILKLLRLDFVWRISPNPPSNTATSKFGVFGSFQFQF